MVLTGFSERKVLVAIDKPDELDMMLPDHDCCQSASRPCMCARALSLFALAFQLYLFFSHQISTKHLFQLGNHIFLSQQQISISKMSPLPPQQGVVCSARERTLYE
jgi:hypothetical protein